jgi:hypothetical protein
MNLFLRAPLGILLASSSRRRPISGMDAIQGNRATNARMNLSAASGVSCAM